MHQWQKNPLYKSSNVLLQIEILSYKYYNYYYYSTLHILQKRMMLNLPVLIHCFHQHLWSFQGGLTNLKAKPSKSRPLLHVFFIHLHNSVIKYPSTKHCQIYSDRQRKYNWRDILVEFLGWLLIEAVFTTVQNIGFIMYSIYLCFWRHCEHCPINNHSVLCV